MVLKPSEQKNPETVVTGTVTSETVSSVDLDTGPREQKKRKREIFFIFLLSFTFVFLTWFEVRLFSTSQQLPFVHSIFFFGLVNFNIIILLLLLFLIFRNVVKVFVERRSGLFGSSLKAKLVAAFVAFSFVPTVLMFVISVFYINSSFDRWFSIKMVGILKSSIEVQNAYYFNAKKRNYHFAHQVASQVRGLGRQALQKKIKLMRDQYALDAVEYYPSMFGERQSSVANEDAIFHVPPVSLEFLQKGIKSQIEASTIHQFGDGNLVRVIVPVQEGVEGGAIVVSSFVPLSLVSRMNDVSSAYEDFRDINPLEYPLKSIYLIVLFLMTLVILLAATWFGFHLARQLAVPLVQLGRATKRVVQGDYTPLNIKTGSEEISFLVSSFNQMTLDLAASNNHLRETLSYIEVVLRNVSAGVISVDKANKITTINRLAANLLKIDPAKYLGRSVRDLLTLEYFRIFAELLRAMQENKAESLQKEIKINVEGAEIPLLMTLSILKDEQGLEIGKVVVFDDLTLIVNAQRAAAWTEVARRIAHEIKNPLTPIRLSAERILRKFGGQILDPAFRESTEMIVKQVNHLKNLVNEFSQFARLPQTRPVRGSIHKTIDEVLMIFRHSHVNAHFENNPGQGVPEFRFDPDQMRRVFVNLVDNSLGACHSDPQNPPIRIQFRTKYEPVMKVLRIYVTDNGPGIPATDLQKVFDPYFSTKESGTGLGLAIVKKIVEDHNGIIRAFGNEPRGTKMVIEIPVSDIDFKKTHVEATDSTGGI
ncbi:MAG: PAS domain-containing protein [Bdellovibrionaceae bacterium]|nr:PAS domain-containing protein [Pseudobdellovibrionaceae bacterium]